MTLEAFQNPKKKNQNNPIKEGTKNREKFKDF